MTINKIEYLLTKKSKMATVGKPEIWNCSAYQQMWKAAFIEDGASSKEKEKEKNLA